MNHSFFSRIELSPAPSFLFRLSIGLAFAGPTYILSTCFFRAQWKIMACLFFSEIFSQPNLSFRHILWGFFIF